MIDNRERKTRGSLTDNTRVEWMKSVEVMQSRDRRWGMKWVEHVATPGPCLKRRLAARNNKGSQIQTSLNAHLQLMQPLLYYVCVYFWSAQYVRHGRKTATLPALEYCKHLCLVQQLHRLIFYNNEMGICIERLKKSNCCIFLHHHTDFVLLSLKKTFWR